VIEKKGRERYCEARFRNLREVFDWVEQYKVFWEARLDKLGGVLNELQNKKKKKKKEYNRDVMIGKNKQLNIKKR